MADQPERVLTYTEQELADEEGSHQQTRVGVWILCGFTILADMALIITAGTADYWSDLRIHIDAWLPLFNVVMLMAVMLYCVLSPRVYDNQHRYKR